ncbi:MAG: DUF350 domain-containing protein [Pseudomonadota bacterium]
MEAVFESFQAGLPHLILHLATATVVWAVGLWVYLFITPHDELKLVREGNISAAISFAGISLAIAVPLGFALSGSVNVIDIAVWGLLTVILQLIAFRVIDMLLGNLSARIERDERAAAIALTALKLSVAALTSAAVAL